MGLEQIWMVDREFKRMLEDRFTTAELAEFLDIDVRDFIDAFEDDVEYNYEELADWIGLRKDENDDTATSNEQ